MIRAYGWEDMPQSDRKPDGNQPRQGEQNTAENCRLHTCQIGLEDKGQCTVGHTASH